MHNSSLVAIAQYFWRLQSNKTAKNMAINKNLTLNFEAINDYPPIRFEIRFERKFPIRRSLNSTYARNARDNLTQPGHRQESRGDSDQYEK